MDNLIKMLLLFGGVLYLSAATGALFGHKKLHRFYFFGNLISLIAGFTFLIVSWLVLRSGAAFSLSFDGPIPWITLKYHLDGLSGFFLFTLSVLTIAVSIYSLGYRHHPTRSGVFFQPVFLLAMTGLLCSFDLISFLFFWELMSFSSYFLIVSDTENVEQKRAGFIYLIMTQLGTTLLLIVTLSLAAFSGGTSFEGINTLGISGVFQIMMLLCLVAGFGTKAGLVPLHIWLPKAHPAAPTPVSALMSGFMIKAAIYGLIRFAGFFEVGLWFGATLLVLGGITAFLGILYAFMEIDLKKLLAYCSIENIGIIFLALGAYQWGRALHNPLVMGAGLIAVGIHVLNHALFKGLLFMGAGAVIQEAKTRNMEKMGGLIKKMPQTALLMLIGSMAGSGLPFTSGFVSEWMIFQVLFLSAGLGENPGMKVMAFLSIAVLALTAGLAAATFVKLFGIIFLAKPRTENISTAREANRGMRLGMGITALLVIFIGICPWLGLSLLMPGVSVKGILPDMRIHPLCGITVLKNSYSPILAVGVFLLILTVLLLVLRKANHRSRTGPTWNCGTELQPQMEYTATSFSKMGRLTFRFLLRPKRNLVKRYEKSRLFLTSLEYQSNLPSIFEEKIYLPVNRLILRISDKIRVLQAGSVKLYLSYILIVLFVLLIYLRLFS